MDQKGFRVVKLPQELAFVPLDLGLSLVSSTYDIERGDLLLVYELSLVTIPMFGMPARRPRLEMRIPFREDSGIAISETAESVRLCGKSDIRAALTLFLGYESRELKVERMKEEPAWRRAVTWAAERMLPSAWRARDE